MINIQLSILHKYPQSSNKDQPVTCEILLTTIINEISFKPKINGETIKYNADVTQNNEMY